MSETLTPEELADRWGCAESYLAKLRSLNEGPPYLKPTPRKVVYLLEDVQAHERGTRIMTNAFRGVDEEQLSDAINSALVRTYGIKGVDSLRPDQVIESVADWIHELTNRSAE